MEATATQIRTIESFMPEVAQFLDDDWGWRPSTTEFERGRFVHRPTGAEIWVNLDKAIDHDVSTGRLVFGVCWPTFEGHQYRPSAPEARRITIGGDYSAETVAKGLSRRLLSKLEPEYAEQKKLRDAYVRELRDNQALAVKFAGMFNGMPSRHEKTSFGFYDSGVHVRGEVCQHVSLDLSIGRALAEEVLTLIQTRMIESGQLTVPHVATTELF